MISDAENAISQKPFTLFGSSFPKDREYTQVDTSWLQHMVMAILIILVMYIRCAEILTR